MSCSRSIFGASEPHVHVYETDVRDEGCGTDEERRDVRSGFVRAVGPTLTLGIDTIYELLVDYEGFCDEFGLLRQKDVESAILSETQAFWDIIPEKQKKKQKMFKMFGRGKK